MAEKTIQRTKQFKTDIKKIMNNTKDSIKMTIDENAISHIVERLTDLYNNPIESVVRELISNAIDSMLESGSKKSISVTLNDFENTLTIQDYGLGMSKNDLINIYSKYGASTKRNNMNVVGAFGLGAKVPLAYTDSFTIISVKNNIEITALVTKTIKGPEIKIINECQTNQENGVTISLVIKNNEDVFKFKNVLKNYHLFQNTLSIPIESNMFDEYNEEPLKAFNNTLKIDENIELKMYHLNRSGHNENYSKAKILFSLLIDEKMTSYSNGMLGFLLEGFKYSLGDVNYFHGQILVDLIPGLVDFNSSRESIMLNDRFYQLTRKINNSLCNIDLEKEDTEVLKNLYSILINDLLINKSSYYNTHTSKKDKILDYIRKVESILNLKPVDLDELSNKNIENVMYHFLPTHKHSKKTDRRETRETTLNYLFCSMISNDDKVIITKKDSLNPQKIRKLLLDNRQKTVYALTDEQIEVLEKYFNFDVVSNVKLEPSKKTSTTYSIIGKIKLNEDENIEVSQTTNEQYTLNELKEMNLLFISSHYGNFELKENHKKSIKNAMIKNNLTEIKIVNLTSNKRLASQKFNKLSFCVETVDSHYFDCLSLSYEYKTKIQNNNDLQTIYLMSSKFRTFADELNEDSNNTNILFNYLCLGKQSLTVEELQFINKYYYEINNIFSMRANNRQKMLNLLPNDSPLTFFIEKIEYLMNLNSLNIQFKESKKNKSLNSVFYDTLINNLNNEIESLRKSLESR